MTKEYDIVVIGGGPAGYVGAIRAAQLGASVCLVEMEQLGGTCLNHGCIPTKTLLHNAEFIHELAVMSNRGIKISDPAVTVDMKSMMKHKNEVVRKLVSGVASLTKSYAIDVIRGIGVIEPDMSISIFENPDSTQSVQSIRGKKIIIAGGSEAVIPPIPGISSSKVLTNREVLALETLPKHLVIIGGGVIGVEIARIFNTFGSQVTIIELENRLVPFFDEEISKSVKQNLEKYGVHIHVGTKVEKITETSKSIEIHDSAGNKHTGDYVLVSTGRKA
ncbi:MAG: FAD-dependent oxidoreductase, partial [Thermoguttaceae bacterium]